LFKDVDFIEIDIDVDKTSTAVFKITSVPTIVFIKDGKEIGRIVGMVSESKLIEKIRNLNNNGNA
jgi:thioredoxin-like negative regulator of GroEL